MAKDADRKGGCGYIFCSQVIRKDGTVIRPKKAKALRIPLKSFKGKKG